MQHQEEWNKNWKNAEDPSKQRKYRDNAPLHRREKFLHARLSDRLQRKTGVKQAAIRVGDTVEVMRGDWKGIRGEVTDVDYDAYKVFVDGVELEANDGSQSKKPVDPSNLLLTDISLKDDRRLKQADEEGREELLEEEEEREQEETGEEDEAEAEETEETDESREDTAEPGVSYGELVDGTIDDAKQALQELDSPDWEAALQAEKNNKDRTTFIDWLENKIEDGDTQ